MRDLTLFRAMLGLPPSANFLKGLDGPKADSPSCFFIEEGHIMEYIEMNSKKVVCFFLNPENLSSRAIRHFPPWNPWMTFMVLISHIGPSLAHWESSPKVSSITAECVRNIMKKSQIGCGCRRCRSINVWSIYKKTNPGYLTLSIQKTSPTTWEFPYPFSKSW